MPRLKKSASKKAKGDRMHDEMSKFKKGIMRSSSGQKVTNPKQAQAIGLSESGQSRPAKKKVSRGRKRGSGKR
jgi:hypothetical protein